ncbi:hypothetical protein F5050DRAFT_1219079 [Lentinula boryana]|uniref:Transmembrane protein 138 n=1 Tax=Lentinula boryana TaxID=40481 RepID=A0ABQ8QIR4_9AGAR|nr:hypothetical protein F5050DRAFT_1219079 [Lentinula boryana]
MPQFNSAIAASPIKGQSPGCSLLLTLFLVSLTCLRFFSPSFVFFFLLLLSVQQLFLVTYQGFMQEPWRSSLFLDLGFYVRFFLFAAHLLCSNLAWIYHSSACHPQDSS